MAVFGIIIINFKADRWEVAKKVVGIVCIPRP